MNKAMDRRGFLKAMLYLAGAAVLPSALVEPVRATIVKPSQVPTRKLPEYELAVSYSNHSQILSQFDPDDQIQIQLRKQMKAAIGRATGDVFVSPYGSDLSGDGTCVKPYQTIGKAAKEVNSGGRIMLKPGVYHEMNAI